MKDNVTVLSHEQKEKLASLRTLIVEDNVVDRRLLRAHLENFGIKSIQEAASGNEGSFKVNTAVETGQPFHLILTDWKMPQKDGLTFLKQLRSENKGKLQVYVIMLTSVGESNRVQEALDVGIDDYVLKPVNGEILIKRILTAIGKIQI